MPQPPAGTLQALPPIADDLRQRGARCMVAQHHAADMCAEGGCHLAGRLPPVKFHRDTMPEQRRDTPGLNYREKFLTTFRSKNLAGRWARLAI
jgi:hypothetical protein